MTTSFSGSCVVILRSVGFGATSIAAAFGSSLVTETSGFSTTTGTAILLSKNSSCHEMLLFISTVFSLILPSRLLYFSVTEMKFLASAGNLKFCFSKGGKFSTTLLLAMLAFTSPEGAKGFSLPKASPQASAKSQILPIFITPPFFKFSD